MRAKLAFRLPDAGKDGNFQNTSANTPYTCFVYFYFCSPWKFSRKPCSFVSKIPRSRLISSNTITEIENALIVEPNLYSRAYVAPEKGKNYLQNF